MTPVSLEHITQLQALLLRMRAYIAAGAKQKAEQLGYDHMALTGKGHVFLEKYADGVELLDPVAYKLVHIHFRDLTYRFMADNHVSTEYVVAAFDEQLARYAEFITEHTPSVVPDEPALCGNCGERCFDEDMLCDICGHCPDCCRCRKVRA